MNIQPASIPNLRPLHGLVVFKTKNRAPDKRYFAKDRESLYKKTSAEGTLVLSQEEMLGTRRVCEATVVPKRTFKIVE
jgi:hypothetical protein